MSTTVKIIDGPDMTVTQTTDYVAVERDDGAVEMRGRSEILIEPRTLDAAARALTSEALR